MTTREEKEQEIDLLEIELHNTKIREEYLQLKIDKLKSEQIVRDITEKTLGIIQK